MSKNLNLYECSIYHTTPIESLRPCETYSNINVVAVSVQQAIKKASHFRVAGEVKKVLEVIQVKLICSIDKI